MRASGQQPISVPMERQSESSLLDVFDVLRESKALILGTALFGLGAALVYIAVVPPKFEAATLIQIEEPKSQSSAASNPYFDTSGLFETRSPAVAEISVMRSGMVLGEVIDRLGLAVSARPNYLPVVGRWLASRATELTPPGLLKFSGTAGYVWGNESIKVSMFAVPKDMEGKPFSLRLTSGGYELRDPDGQVAVDGQIGVPARFNLGAGQAEITVASATGGPGAVFLVERLARGAVLENLQRQLKIDEQGRQSGMLKVRLSGDSPDHAANIVNEIASTYLKQHTQRRTAEAEKALLFVESTLPNLRNQILQAEDKLAKVKKQNAAVELSTRAKQALDQSARIEASLVEWQSKRDQHSASLLPGHPNMLAVEAQIASAKAELDAVNKRIKSLPPVEQETVEASRELQVKSELYAGLLSGAQQIRLAKEGRAGNIRIVDPAWTPPQPSGPAPVALLATGASGGLALGMLLALLRRSVRSGVQSPDVIEDRSSLDVLTTVPYSKTQRTLVKAHGRARAQNGATKVLAICAPQDPAIESLRSMRTALESQLPGAGSTVVVITGPTHAIGKSFTSTNLAAVLGASGNKVLLIDADLRRGKLNEAFNVAYGPGLSEILAGKLTRAQGVHCNVMPNVDLIAAGRRCQSPADLLSTKYAQHFFHECSEQYDYVIVDTPPVLAASDAEIVAQWADAVFLVVRAEVTSLREVDETEKRLAQRGVEVRGVIYSGVDSSKQRNSIYSYGGYDYLSSP